MNGIIRFAYWEGGLYFIRAPFSILLVGEDHNTPAETVTTTSHFYDSIFALFQRAWSAKQQL
jgi:hypothetical protein